MPPRLFYFVRHGETDWNAAGRWQGHTDIPLNANGVRQARTLAETLRREGLSAVVSSDLLRALETARIVAEALGIPLAHVHAGLRERAFGPFEGLTRLECEERHPEAWRAWVDAQRAPPGAEARHVLAARVAAAVAEVASRIPVDVGPLLVVTHGGSLRALLSAALDIAVPPVGNCAVWRVTWEGRVVAAEPLLAELSPAARAR